VTDPPEQLPSRGVEGTLGGVALAVGLTASSVLALRHLGAPLAGCGLDSPCERALASAFARVPGLGWPVAFLGAAYFAGLALAWARAARAWPCSLSWVVRAGGVAALAFLAAAVSLGAFCPFCLAAQAAGLAFWWVSERRRACARSRGDELAFTIVFVVVAGGFVLAAQRAERARDAALSAELAAAAAQPEQRGFTGRHRLGPERAPLRLVLFLDYRCADCRRIDAEALALVRSHAGLSLSIKHFPLDDDCNRRARTLGRDPHPGACLAARVAEAAAMAGGEEAFWRVHAWLFARELELTEAALERELAALGLAPGPFLEELHGVEAGARVTADIEEGLALGLEGTPAVFLNGVELREWRAPGALTRAVEVLMAGAPPALGPESDVPPSALARALADWRAEPRREIPTRAGLTPAPGLVLELWGDYLDEATRTLLAHLRTKLAEREATLVFRHYPLDADCVGAVPALHPGACRLARLAEAARLLGGEAALERLEPWLVTRTAESVLDVAEAAQRAGLPAAELAELSASPSTLAALTLDVDAARRLGVQSIPCLFIDGKRVARWRLDGEDDVLAAILADAGR
jgi:protein-disulfide isomerase/uncharacterized membrane protein